MDILNYQNLVPSGYDLPLFYSVFVCLYNFHLITEYVKFFASLTSKEKQIFLLFPFKKSLSSEDLNIHYQLWLSSSHTPSNMVNKPAILKDLHHLLQP